MGRRASASSAYSSFARNDVPKRHAITAGEAAYATTTPSIDRAKHASPVHSTLSGPPPRPPLHKGGKREAAAAAIRATNSEGNPEWCNPTTLFGPPPLAPPSQGGKGCSAHRGGVTKTG